MGEKDEDGPRDGGLLPQFTGWRRLWGLWGSILLQNPTPLALGDPQRHLYRRASGVWVSFCPSGNWKR